MWGSHQPVALATSGPGCFHVYGLHTASLRCTFKSLQLSTDSKLLGTKTSLSQHSFTDSGVVHCTGRLITVRRTVRPSRQLQTLVRANQTLLDARFITFGYRHHMRRNNVVSVTALARVSASGRSRERILIN